MSNEQSIRDELAQALDEIESGWLTGEARLPYPPEVAEDLLRHPVIRRIQAEAVRRARDELGVYIGDEDGEYWDGYRNGQRRQFAVLTDWADRIERGETA